MDTADHPSLHAGITEAATKWPDVNVDRAAFTRALEDRSAAADEPPAIETLKIADLWLAFACGAGDPAAVAHVRGLVSGLATELRPKFPRLPSEWEDVEQRLLRDLLVATEERRAKILDYAGTGELRAWLRVALTRLLLNVATRENRERPEDLPFFEALSEGGTDAEADYLRAACKAELRASLTHAASMLSDRERALLRFAYADGRSVNEIGAVYGVHGATASRWIQKARERLATAVREDLVRRLALSDTEAASMVRNAISQIDVTLSRFLGT